MVKAWAKRPWIDLVHERPRLPEHERLGLSKLYAHKQALSADRLDQFIFLREGLQRLQEVFAHLAAPCDEVFTLQDGERRQSRDHGEIVSAECRRMDLRAVEAREDASYDFLSCDHGGDRNHRRTQTFGEADNIGLYLPVLCGKECSRPPETSMDLVEDQDCLVLPAELLNPRQVTVRGDDDPRPDLDRLEDDRCHVPCGEIPLECIRVVERNRLCFGEQGLEPFPPHRVAGHGEGAVGEAVVGVVGVEDSRALGDATGEFQRRLDRLRSGVCEKDHVEPRDPLHQCLSEETGEERDIQLDQVGERFAQNLCERPADDGVVVADVGDAEAGDAVQIAAAVLVPEMAALGAGVNPVVTDELHRLGPRRIDVLRMQLRVFPQPLPEQVEYVEFNGGATLTSGGLNVIHFNRSTDFGRSVPAKTICRSASSLPLNDNNLHSVGSI